MLLAAIGGLSTITGHAEAGPDESYFSRDESYAGQPGSTAVNFTAGQTPRPTEWQQTWVSHLAPSPPA